MLNINLKEIKKLDPKEFIKLDDNGETLLHYLTYHEYYDKKICLYIISQLSIEELNTVNSSDMTPLCLAIDNYNDEICELLIPKMNLKGLVRHDNTIGRRPSRQAEKNNLWEVREWIDNRIIELEETIYEEIENAYFIYSKYPYETKGFVLIDSKEKNQAEGIKLLKETFDKIDNTYESPLHMALKKDGCNSLYEFIIEHMDIKDINNTGKLDYTVLHLCALHNKNYIADILIPKIKDNINYQSKSNGETALHLAVEKNNVELSKLLINNMSSEAINSLNYSDQMALDIIKENYKNNVTLLNMLETKIRAQKCITN
jgi:ankyrin repeat protein